MKRQVTLLVHTRSVVVDEVFDKLEISSKDALPLQPMSSGDKIKFGTS